jgi:hypothetical protein
MVAITGRLRTEAAAISPQLDALISDVILGFARDRNWGPESYDIHYHDEPVWYIRRDDEVHSGSSAGSSKKIVRVTRVQLAVFASDGEARLVVMPDAHKYLPDERRIKAKATESDRAEGKQAIPVAEIEALLHDGQRQRAYDRLLETVNAVWYRAESIKPRSSA